MFSTSLRKRGRADRTVIMFLQRYKPNYHQYIFTLSLHSEGLIRFIINKIPSVLCATPGWSHLRQGCREITLVGDCQARTELAGELWVPVWNLEKYWQELQYSHKSQHGLAITVSSGKFPPLPCPPHSPPRHTVIVIIWNCHVQYLSHKTKI